MVALTIGLLFAVSELGKRLDSLFFDSLAPRLGQPRRVDDLLVVAITEADYDAASTPLALWGVHLAPLLTRIAAGRPEAIGLDLLLPRFPLVRVVEEHDRTVFRTLKRVSRTTRLVSGYGITASGGIREPFVVYQKILGPNGYGFFNLTPDSDGVWRRQALALKAGDGRTLYAFAALLAGQKPRPGRSITPDWRNPAVIPTLSVKEALAANPAAFEGKTVVIGADFDFEDRHPTPVGRESGVVIQARLVEALKNGRTLSDPGWPVSTLAPALIVLVLGLVLTRRSPPLRTALVGLGLTAGLAAACGASLAGGLVLRPSAGLAGLVVLVAARLAQGVSIIKDAFGRYVTREVRDAILSGRIPLDGEMKEVSVLFADLRGFTPFVETSPPREVVRVVNGYFEEMAQAIRANKGLVFQYVGDEIYAVFGAPTPLPDHARWAVRAGLEMRRRLEAYNRKLAAEGLPPLKNGIGIHSGPALAANIGGGDRLRYALVGDTVNLGSRLEGLTKKFGVQMIISGQTRDLIGDEVELEPLPETPIKGKSRPVKLFAVK